jgi:hypothetical protein
MANNIDGGPCNLRYILEISNGIKAGADYENEILKLSDFKF